MKYENVCLEKFISAGVFFCFVLNKIISETKHKIQRIHMKKTLTYTDTNYRSQKWKRRRRKKSNKLNISILKHHPIHNNNNKNTIYNAYNMCERTRCSYTYIKIFCNELSLQYNWIRCEWMFQRETINK